MRSLDRDDVVGAGQPGSRSAAARSVRLPLGTSPCEVNPSPRSALDAPAEHDGQTIAAVVTNGCCAIAAPFVPTTSVVALLRPWSSALQEAASPPGP